MKNIISVVGGMGNQMFQCAFSLSFDPSQNATLNDYLATHKQSNYGSELYRVFGISLKNNWIDDFLVWFVRKCIVFTYKPKYSKLAYFLLHTLFFIGIQIKTDYLTLSNDKKNRKYFKTIWYGRFQSERYFVNCKDSVVKAFSFDLNKLSQKSKDIAQNITLENSISIHIRRGDYLTSANAGIFGGICTAEYYEKAIQYIMNEIENPVFYIFSDDIPWVEKNLTLPNASFINWNQKENSWEDMYLMSLCKHNVVANSTFSWWGAWLNKNPDKRIICPSKYTNSDDTADFYPDSWIKISIHNK